MERGFVDFRGELEGDADYTLGDLVEAEGSHFWFAARRDLILFVIARHFPSPASFMDIGCGTGYMLRALKHAHPRLVLAGTDLQPASLEIAARSCPEAALHLMDCRKIPFRDEFDVLGAFDVLEHVTDDDRALTQLFRATRPGGGLILTVPQHPFLWSAVDEFSCHRRRYTRSELVTKVASAGFEVERVTSFVTLLMPVLYLKRRRWKGNKPFDPLDAVRIPSLLNRTCAYLMAIERCAIRAGISLPFGGSLLLVARKSSRQARRR